MPTTAFTTSITPRLDPVDCELLHEHDVRLNVLRLDLMHPHIFGNKWFKLRLNLQSALEQQLPAILSFGGAYSNHLYALAAAGKYFGLRTFGVVRGELVEPLNPVLAFARQQGMELIPVTRADYRRKTTPEFLASLRSRFGEFYLIPEGGSNTLAVAGCCEIAEFMRWQTDTGARYVALACGTGTTMAGVVTGLSRMQQLPPASVLGIAVVNAPGALAREVQHWLPAANAVHWSVLDDYHLGGYARRSPELEAFLQEFARISTIPLEPVYTGRLMFGLFDQIRRGLIAPGSEVIALHTGGIYTH